MITKEQLEALTTMIRLGDGHEDQERVVAAALRRLLIHGQRGVVLADEVGFGKTYEALAITAHLCAHARQDGESFERVLVLCKPALVRKWQEETSGTHSGRGFPQYLSEDHPARELFESVRCVDSRAAARELRENGTRAQRVDGRLQVPPGLYVVNEKLLSEERRQASTLLRQVWRAQWDLVIVDEAHHYARGNLPARIFAPDGDLRNYFQEALQFDRVLALTATPFELTPQQLVDLLALVRVESKHLELIESRLKDFVRELNRFFELRGRSSTDPLRAQQVVRLQELRDGNPDSGDFESLGLQCLLRRFLIRNVNSDNERRYFVTSRCTTGFEQIHFDKLGEDLQQQLQRLSLIPFEDEHALFYLELREVIQDVTDRARNEMQSGTFISTDLRQGLSSYPQVAASKLMQRDLESVVRLRALVDEWNRSGKLHPKVAALVEVICTIAKSEIQKLRVAGGARISKVLIFNKLTSHTAPQLREVLSPLLEQSFENYLSELLNRAGISRRSLADTVRKAVDRQLAAAEREFKENAAFAPFRLVPVAFTNEEFVRHRGRSLVHVFRYPLRRRAVQTLALIDVCREASVREEETVEAWVEREVTGATINTIRDVIRRDLAISADDEGPYMRGLERAERELVIELETVKSVGIVGRYDGKNIREREGHRRNFNRRHNPFVLLVGAVGEEGIDLQEQCRYVIHYDLEWNPARMEQREGRVDRMGWGRRDEGYIDVRFLLLKGTYEERIFHTVMQRDQWFQILIGSKRRELGQLPEDAEEDVRQDEITDDGSMGALTEVEKARVMLDLRPE